MIRFLKRSMIVVTVIGGASCGSRFTETQPLESPEVTMQVENRNFNDATLYAVDGDLRVRVGRVTGKTNQRLSFRWVQEELQMEVRFTAGPRLLSGRHQIVPGASDNLLLIIDLSPNVTPLLTGRR